MLVYFFQLLEVLASTRLSPTLASLYGPHLTCEVTLGQAKILATIASCISAIPQEPSKKDLEYVEPDPKPAAEL